MSVQRCASQNKQSPEKSANRAHPIRTQMVLAGEWPPITGEARSETASVLESPLWMAKILVLFHPTKTEFGGGRCTPSPGLLF